ncbi:TauD/TfdA family dioxygenase [Aliikangiella maris]|uniref:TauD/TfdA family dioxygenase n=2 Tax=Aliikangiella maris TaxID=3162458 RepID=A0ABV2BWA5_9GAMM
MKTQQQWLEQTGWHGQLPDLEQVTVKVPQAILSTFEEHFNQPGLELDLEKIHQKEPLVLPVEWVNQVREKIQLSPGFVCVKTDEDQFTDLQLRFIYFYIASALGNLNDRYGYLFDIADRGLDYTKEAIPVSKTNADTSFHTDCTAVDYKPDIVGLLCVHPAKKGGRSMVANAADLFVYLRENHPQALDALSQPLMRDVITPGKEQSVEAIRNNQFPIFAFDDFGLRFRYMRYWIETAYQKTQTELPQAVIDAMNIVDDYLAQDENIFYCSLERGDIIFVNNAFLAHNRTAFENYSEPDKQRVLVRTWINWRVAQSG